MTPKSKSQTVKRPYRRPDTYDAAADRVGLSRTHVFEIFQGKRTTTAANAKALRAWAKENAKKGRNDSPAVVAALSRLGAA
jgi:hypothetical protein